MYSTEFYGSWWTLEAPDDEVPGVVSFDENGPVLTLHGTWPLAENAQDPSPATAGRLISQHFRIVHGLRHSDWKPVTLLDVRGRIVHLPFRTFGSDTYTVDTVLIGHHFPTADGFTRVSFEFDYLSAWLRPPPRATRMTNNLDVLEVDTRSIQLGTCQLEDGSIVGLRSGLHGTDSESSIQLDEFTALDINAPAPSERQVLLTRVQEIRDLLTLTLGRPIRTKWVKLRSANMEAGADALYRLDEPLETSDISSSQALNDVLDYRMPTLLTPGESSVMPSGITSAELIGRWCSVYPRAGSMLSLLLSQYSVDEMLPHHRYASLFSAAEELHKCLGLPRHQIPEADRAARRARVERSIASSNIKLAGDDRDWLNNLVRDSRNDRSLPRKLNDLLVQAGPVGKQAIDIAPTFCRDAARSRGRISHSNAGSESQEASRLSYELVLELVLRAIAVSRLVDRSNRRRFLTAAAERHRYKLILRRLAATEST
jgi:hypothetical protein